MDKVQRLFALFHHSGEIDVYGAVVFGDIQFSPDITAGFVEAFILQVGGDILPSEAYGVQAAYSHFPFTQATNKQSLYKLVV